MIYNYEPIIEHDDINHVVSCLKEGIANPKHVLDLEKNLSNKFNVKSLSCISGTAALHMSLLALGVGKGDEVICPEMTFASTWNAIIYVGAKPVFVDICPDTWCLDHLKVKEKITRRTRAIITVDIFGNPCRYDELQKICKANNLYLIIDGAESLGSSYKGQSIFSFGDIAITSFNLNKIITSCGGGAIFTNNNELLNIINRLRNQNKIDGKYDYYGLGYNYRIGSINAAIVNSQLTKIDDTIKRKKDIANQYRNLLNCQNIAFQKDQDSSIPNYWLNVVKFKDKEKRDNVLNALCTNNIEAKLTFKPASSVNWLKQKYNLKQKEIACNLYNRCLALPSSKNLSNNDISLICTVVKKNN
jgi:perosamine synthetase